MVVSTSLNCSLVMAVNDTPVQFTIMLERNLLCILVIGLYGDAGFKLVTFFNFCMYVCTNLDLFLVYIKVHNLYEYVTRCKYAYNLVKHIEIRLSAFF